MRLLLIISIFWLSININAEASLTKAETKQVTKALKILDATSEPINTRNNLVIEYSELSIKRAEAWIIQYQATISMLEARIKWLDVLDDNKAIEKAKEDFYIANIKLEETIAHKDDAENALKESDAKYDSKGIEKAQESRSKAFETLNNISKFIELLDKFNQSLENFTLLATIVSKSKEEWDKYDKNRYKAHNEYIDVNFPEDNEILDTALVKAHAKNVIEKTKDSMSKCEEHLKKLHELIPLWQAMVESQNSYIESYRAMLEPK